jgi:hypothetical protein
MGRHATWQEQALSLLAPPTLAGDVVAVQGEPVHAVHLVLEGRLDVRCYQGLGGQQGRQQAAGPDELVVDERDLEHLRYRWAVRTGLPTLMYPVLSSSYS